MNGTRPLLIGLTGGIASGKTTVADLFAARGIPVIDTDVLSREVVAPGTPGFDAVRAVFGDGVLGPDGSIDRAALRSRVFADRDARHQLESIVHPRVMAAVADAARTAGGPYQIHVIPLLVETDLQDRVDRVLVVDCDRIHQLHRLLARDEGSRDEAEQILDAQVDRGTRLAAADDVIDNSGDPEDLDPLVERLHRHYVALAESGDLTGPGLRLP